MRTFLFLLEKEIKQILRNRIILAMIIALPTIQLAILPYAATYEIRHINLAVVDADHSTLSRELTAKLNASGYFNLISAGTSYEEALELVVHSLPSGLRISFWTRLICWRSTPTWDRSTRTRCWPEMNIGRSYAITMFVSIKWLTARSMSIVLWMAGRTTRSYSNDPLVDFW